MNVESVMDKWTRLEHDIPEKENLSSCDAKGDQQQDSSLPTTVSKGYNYRRFFPSGQSELPLSASTTKP